jgi:hypothetical protein
MTTSEIEHARRELIDIAARWACGFVNATAVVDAGTNALVVGVDSPTLRVLAGVLAAQATIDVPDLLDRAMDELELPYFGPGHPTSRLLAAAALAAEHVHGRLAARDLCRIIHQHYGHEAHDLIEPLAVLDDCYDSIDYIEETEHDLERQTLDTALALIAAAMPLTSARPQRHSNSDSNSRFLRGRKPLA